MIGRIFIATSGWNYKHWSNGVFYPKSVKQKNWFSFYCRYFNTVEINNTFYRLPYRAVFENWYKSSTDSFVFTVKASRFITHMKKLSDPEQHVAKLMANSSGLQDKLGVILFQLPPAWNFNSLRLERFCECIVNHRTTPLTRFVIEVRNSTWQSSECLNILQKYNIALAFTDWPGCSIEDPLTSNFAFVRRHGPENLYASNYSDQYLEKEAH